MEQIETLIHGYKDWLFENITIQKCDKIAEITLPFLDRHNDCLQVYLTETGKNTWLLTDSGYIIGDLESCGCSLTDKRKELLIETLSGFGVSLNEKKELVVKTDKENFSQNLNDLIQGMLAADDLAYLSASNVSQVFTADVKNWLKSIKVRHISADVKGKNGLSFHFNFVIAGDENVPERYVESFSNFDLAHAQALAYKWSQIKDNREYRTKMFVLYNNETQKLSKNVVELCKTENIIPILYSDRDSIKAEITA